MTITSDALQSVIDPSVLALLNLEARLADEARYSEWEQLWTDDGLYWVPMSEDADPATQLSYIYDNRKRIRQRINQLNSGARHSQTPPSKMRRLISNVELLSTEEATGELTIGANFVLYEYRYAMTTWAGRVVYRIRDTAEGPRLAGKTVHLVNAGGPLPTMAFLL